jgi:hypothetical protein
MKTVMTVFRLRQQETLHPTLLFSRLFNSHSSKYSYHRRSGAACLNNNSASS